MQIVSCRNQECSQCGIPIKVDVPDNVDYYEFSANYLPQCTSCGSVCDIPELGEVRTTQQKKKDGMVGVDINVDGLVRLGVVVCVAFLGTIFLCILVFGRIPGAP